MKNFDIQNVGKGAIKQLSPDPRNFKMEALLGVGALTPFDWNKGFSVEDKVGKLKVEHQGTSSSCVAQAWSKYQEVLDMLEGKPADYSARDIYSRIYQEPGGAYIMDGAKLLVKRGVALERDVLSYESEKPPTEAYMRLQEAPHEVLSLSKSYATTTHNDIEWIAQMIRDNNGVVSGFTGDNQGWSQADIKPPASPQWAHAVYLLGACMRNGRKAIKFINSWGENWGENGYGFFYADSLGEMFDIWTLIDLINNNMFTNLIREKGRKEVYAMINNKPYYIGEQAFTDLLADKQVRWEDIKEVDFTINLQGVIK